MYTIVYYNEHKRHEQNKLYLIDAIDFVKSLTADNIHVYWWSGLYNINDLYEINIK